MSQIEEPIGIVSTGIYLPKERMTAAQIAEASGLPLEVVRDKMGITAKTIPGEDDHTCQMGIWAAEEALKRGNVSSEEIDLIIYIGEEHKEYPIWTAGIKLQEAIGARKAWAFDIALRCGTTVMGLKLARALMDSDLSIRTVLLAGGYRNVDYIDYTNDRTRFMYNLSAGGGALILQRGYRKNHLLETEIKTDGAFSEDVVVLAGGTKQPLTIGALQQRLNYLDVPDPEGMKQRLEAKSMENFLNVIKQSLKKSHLTVADLDYLAILHMKRSAHDFILQELGLHENQSLYLSDYGHIGQIDQILSLQLAAENGKINDGDVVVLVSAGIGYAWGATTVRWGEQ